MKPADLLQGTLDMLILKAVSLRPLHGYGVLLRIQQLSRNALEVQQGSLYPALHRLAKAKLISAEWGVSDNGRRAKFYSLTAAGERHLESERDRWRRTASAVDRVMAATVGDLPPEPRGEEA